MIRRASPLFPVFPAGSPILRGLVAQKMSKRSYNGEQLIPPGGASVMLRVLAALPEKSRVGVVVAGLITVRRRISPCNARTGMGASATVSVPIQS